MALQVEVVSAAAGLHPAIPFYYRLERGERFVDDFLRADSGHARILLSGGDGHLEWQRGGKTPTMPTALFGPIHRSPRVLVEGPLDFIGFTLTPEAWGQIFHVPADGYKEQIADLDLALSLAPGTLLSLARDAASLRDFGAALDQILLMRMRPLKPVHADLIRALRQWLSSGLFPDVGALYRDANTMGARQIMRVAGRYFGAPPKLLARKYGALRTASLMLKEGGRVPIDAINHYADQSHMIREIRQFTGQTPRSLMNQSSPIMRLALSSVDFPEIVPVA